MAGVIDYAALPIICDLLGTRDPERLLDQLLVIREHQRAKEDN